MTPEPYYDSGYVSTRLATMVAVHLHNESESDLTGVATMVAV